MQNYNGNIRSFNYLLWHKGVSIPGLPFDTIGSITS